METFQTQTGDSKWIISDKVRTDVHHLRHTHDAILVGVQTVLHDNPFLTTRCPMVERIQYVLF
jgi:diaminohydroxyphosphoribosylaminopyrimidine deaminase / 5-amino-6-(5-phosphoribosylamino)uracil reductase